MWVFDLSKTKIQEEEKSHFQKVRFRDVGYPAVDLDPDQQARDNRPPRARRTPSVPARSEVTVGTSGEDNIGKGKGDNQADRDTQVEEDKVARHHNRVLVVLVLDPVEPEVVLVVPEPQHLEVEA